MALAVAEGWLVCRAGARLCAVPLRSAIETLRPVPIEPLTGSSGAVAGLCRIRGAPVPVVDAARLLGDDGGRAARLVVLSVADRQVALAVSEVIGIRSFALAEIGPLPPLLREANAAAIAAIAALDSEFVMVLDAARLLSDTVLDAVEAAP